MARPGLIAALLLPLPFAALPLVAVLIGGSTFTGASDAVYVPVSNPAIVYDEPASVASWQKTRLHTTVAEELRRNCDDYSAES